MSDDTDLPGPADVPVLSRRDGPVLVLTLHRPDRLNAVSLPLSELLLDELTTANRDPEVRCVVLTGAGRAFCVGADLKAHGEGPPDGEERVRYVRTAQRVNEVIQLGDTPVVAAVNGHAIGGGLEMALSADFMIVSDEAKLRFPEVALGTFVGGGTVYTLAERVGVVKARELVYLGDFFRGSEAAAMGVAWRSVPTDQVLPEALALARRLAERAPRSLARAKQLIGPAGAIPRNEALQREAEALLEIFGTRDWAEGVAAFHEKRAPRYTGA